MDDDRTKAKAYCCCCIVFSLIVILAISWDTVDPTEWGLKYNKISKQIDKTEVYDGGRYLVGLFTSFIHFPRTQQIIEFSLRPSADSPPLRTRTGEGLALGLHVAFQYELIPDKIPNLYSLANIQYEQTFIRIARDVILQTAGNYNAPQYWRERTKIGDEMEAALDTELQKAFARCRKLEITQIELPESYEASIVDTQIEQQYTQMKRFEQEAKLTRQQIDVLRSEARQNVTITNATANAEAYALRQGAEALATQNSINAEKDAYKTIEDELNLPPEDLQRYIFYNGLQDKNSKLFVGFKNNMFLNNVGK